MNSTDEYRVAELKLRCFQSLIGGNDISRIENARKLWAWISTKDSEPGSEAEFVAWIEAERRLAAKPEVL